MHKIKRNMKFTTMKKASDYEVEEFLIKNLELSDYQRSVLRCNEIIRFAPFDFYKDIERKKINLIWRFTLPLFIIYFILAVICLPISYIITGEWNHGKSFENFHIKWCNKLNIK